MSADDVFGTHRTGGDASCGPVAMEHNTDDEWGWTWVPAPRIGTAH
jgi:hypothetical protein